MANWFRNFMAGRYGTDQLNMALLVGYLLLTLLGGRSTVMRLLTLLLLVAFWVRFLSRDTSRRYAENQKFLQLAGPWLDWCKSKYTRLKDRTHRYFTCPQCGQTLRVPRGRGKISITCPRCQHILIRKV